MRGVRGWRGWTWAHRASAAAFLAVLVLAWRVDLSWIQGSPTATLLLGRVAIVDPLAALEVTMATRTVTWSLVCGVVIPIALVLLLGRVFCGWLCPLGLLLELMAEGSELVRRRLSRLGVPCPRWSLDAKLQYALLVVCLIGSAIAGVPVFTLFSPINLVLLGVAGLSAAAAIVIGGICLFELLIPRGFCRAICPLGALYTLLGRYAPWRVRVRPTGRQSACGLCTLRCPMGIRVMEDHVLAGAAAVDDPACTRCGSCTDGCPGGVLRLGFTRSSADASQPVCRGSKSITG